MKAKILIYTMALSTLMLTGCAKNNAQAQNKTSEAHTTTTSEQATTATDNAHNTTATDTATSTTHGNTNANGNYGEETTMITEEEAKRIALSHAGFTTDQVTFVKSGVDHDDGHILYDVEFYTTDQKEYDYEIDAYTGEIWGYDYDAEYYPHSENTSTEERISEDSAKKIALDQVSGATQQDIREFKSEYDNGKFQYEGKIYYDKKEYEFEIDGHTGAILEWDVEPIYG